MDGTSAHSGPGANENQCLPDTHAPEKSDLLRQNCLWQTKNETLHGTRNEYRRAAYSFIAVGSLLFAHIKKLPSSGASAVKASMCALFYAKQNAAGTSCGAMHMEKSI